MVADSTELPEGLQGIEKDVACGHTGKWHGVGQSSIGMPDKIIIIYTTVCGECGSVKLDVKTIAVQSNKSTIAVPQPIFKR